MVWACDSKIGALGKKESDVNRSTNEQEERKAQEKMFAQGESLCQRKKGLSGGGGMKCATELHSGVYDHSHESGTEIKGKNAMGKSVTGNSWADTPDATASHLVLENQL